MVRVAESQAGKVFFTGIFHSISFSPCFFSERYRASLTVASDLGLLVAIGGNNEAQAASRTVETFDLLAKDGGSWTSRPEWNIPKEVNGHCSFYQAPHIYIVGGRHVGIEQPDTYRPALSRMF